jgi:hypothetical protein
MTSPVTNAGTAKPPSLPRWLTSDEAYVIAGYKESRGNAATLKQNQSILYRIAKLLAERESIHAQAIGPATSPMIGCHVRNIVRLGGWLEPGDGYCPSPIMEGVGSAIGYGANKVGNIVATLKKRSKSAKEQARLARCRPAR